MKREPNLIESQQAAVDAILAAREQGPRAAMHGMTLLNRNPRVLGGIRRAYERDAARMGFDTLQVKAQWQDIKDAAELEAAAE